MKCGKILTSIMLSVISFSHVNLNSVFAMMDSDIFEAQTESCSDLAQVLESDEIKVKLKKIDKVIELLNDFDKYLEEGDISQLIQCLTVAPKGKSDKGLSETQLLKLREYCCKFSEYVTELENKKLTDEIEKIVEEAQKYEKLFLNLKSKNESFLDQISKDRDMKTKINTFLWNQKNLISCEDYSILKRAQSHFSPTSDLSLLDKESLLTIANAVNEELGFVEVEQIKDKAEKNQDFSEVKDHQEDEQEVLGEIIHKKKEVLSEWNKSIETKKTELMNSDNKGTLTKKAINKIKSDSGSLKKELEKFKNSTKNELKKVQRISNDLKNILVKILEEQKNYDELVNAKNTIENFIDSAILSSREKVAKKEESSSVTSLTLPKKENFVPSEPVLINEKLRENLLESNFKPQDLLEFRDVRDIFENPNTKLRFGNPGSAKYKGNTIHHNTITKNPRGSKDHGVSEGLTFFYIFDENGDTRLIALGYHNNNRDHSKYRIYWAIEGLSINKKGIFDIKENQEIAAGWQSK